MKSTFVKDIADGDAVDTYFAVASKENLRQYKHKPGLWFGMHISDKTGRISAKYWGNENEETQQIFDSLDIGDVINVRGSATEYRGQIQISINPHVDHIEKTDQYAMDDLMPSAGLNIGQLKSALRECVASVADPQIHALLELFFADETFLDKYAMCPAAKSYHHGYVGGLMQHSLNMVRLARAVSANYPRQFDADMLIAGCLLHDIGKLRQYEIKASITYTADGEYMGHIAMGVMMVQERISHIRKTGGRFDDDKERHLVHVVLSHHGELEHGSPVKPVTPEAMLVHKVDSCDAQVKHLLEENTPF